MSQVNPSAFPERRQGSETAVPVIERRQFANSHDELSPPARELGLAIDRYKLTNRRRFVTYEEILHIVTSLGYSKNDESSVEGTIGAENQAETVG